MVILLYPIREGQCVRDGLFLVHLCLVQNHLTCLEFLYRMIDMRRGERSHSVISILSIRLRILQL